MLKDDATNVPLPHCFEFLPKPFDKKKMLSTSDETGVDWKLCHRNTLTVAVTG